MASTYPAYLEWPELRRAILAGGGIGPSPDWPSDWIPGDLFRKHGKAPDLVAAETHPWSARWGNGDDSAMFSHLNAAFEEWKRYLADRPRRDSRWTDAYALAAQHGLSLRSVWNVARAARLQGRRGRTPRRTYFDSQAFAEALAATPRAPRRRRERVAEELAA
jgi:hypothetical protein